MKVRYAEAEVAVCRGISYPERPFERVAGSLVIPLLDLLHACFDEARIGVLLRGLRVHDRDWGEQYDREAKRYDNIFFHDYFPQRYSLTLAPCPLSYSSITFTYTLRSRGPSNSQKKIACQEPSISLPSSTITALDTPTMLDFIWAAELPSVWP